MLYSLPSITEDVISSYVASRYSGSYSVAKSFSVQPASLPLIVVKAGKFREVEPNTGLFEGQLSVAVLTQIDDVDDPLTVHDNTVATIYDLFEAGQSVLTAYANAQPNFHLWSIQISSYDQEASERQLASIIEFDVNCQTLPC